MPLLQDGTSYSRDEADMAFVSFVVRRRGHHRRGARAPQRRPAPRRSVKRARDMGRGHARQTRLNESQLRAGTSRAAMEWRFASVQCPAVASCDRVASLMTPDGGVHGARLASTDPDRIRRVMLRCGSSCHLHRLLDGASERANNHGATQRRRRPERTHRGEARRARVRG